MSTEVGTMVIDHGFDIDVQDSVTMLKILEEKPNREKG
jgi:hypothetical protein